MCVIRPFPVIEQSKEIRITVALGCQRHFEAKVRFSTNARSGDGFVVIGIYQLIVAGHNVCGWEP